MNSFACQPARPPLLRLPFPTTRRLFQSLLLSTVTAGMVSMGVGEAMEAVVEAMDLMVEIALGHDQHQEEMQMEAVFWALSSEGGMPGYELIRNSPSRF